MVANANGKRTLSAIVLAAAMVVSLSSTFLIAALCPHMRPEAMHCIAQSAEKSMSNHDAGHKQVHPSLLSAKDRFAVGEPNEQCGHCSLHSLPVSPLATLRRTTAAQGTYDLAIPTSSTQLESLAPSPIAIVPSRAHGPPGGQTSKYILINILRI